MNDLNQLLHDAAGSDGGRRLDPQDLLASGHRKVRNRRIAVAGGVTAALVAAAAVVGWLPGDDDRPDVVDDPNHRSATYDEVRVPIAEVERRCSIVLNARNRSDGVEYVTGVGDNRTGVPGAEADQLVDAPEGGIVLLVPQGDRWPGGQPDYDGPGWPGSSVGPNGISVAVSPCVVPQLPLLDGISDERNERDSGDPAALLDQCSRFTGFDVRGWDVLTARGDFVGNQLLLARSDNGFVAVCEVFGGRAMGPGGEEIVGPNGRALLDVVPAPVFSGQSNVDPVLRDDLFAYYCVDPLPTEVITCAGTLPDPVDDHRVEVLFDGTSAGAATTRSGEFELRTESAPGRQAVVVRLVSPDDEVLWSEPLG